MLKEIVYWVYQFFSNLRQSKKSKDNGRLDSVMFVSICLFVNVLTLLNIIEYYTTYDIIEKIPITTKYEFSSWICIIVIMIPFIGLIYKRFKFRKFNLQFLIYKCRKYVSYLPPC